MSETIHHNNNSSESLCTVIENIADNIRLKVPEFDVENECNLSATCSEDIESERNDKRLESSENDESSIISSNESPRNQSPQQETTITHIIDLNLHPPEAKPRTKIKKSVSFDTTDEKVLKFISGDPIVDQKNPFKQNFSNGSLPNKKKKTPPPVPTKRSTLSIRKTVTQQLREREREKEKERERLKNETNQRKSNGTLNSPDDFITTEEVLKQSKYVKTYIKNPDPYFVYDPTVLARIKFEELKEVADKKPPRKPKLNTRERLKDLKNKPHSNVSSSKLSFKKCSKPNYPELADIKVKTGTELNETFFSAAEVSKNAKKFDERVKKLHISSDDDLDEIEEPLTKSESSDEVTLTNSTEQTETEEPNKMNGYQQKNSQQDAAVGTFTNTIKSQEFQEYLQKKGLTLIPKKIPAGAQPLYNKDGAAKSSSPHISFRQPESVQISLDTVDGNTNKAADKKPSVFQRLLANSIFASRRKTMPKETVPTNRSLNGGLNLNCNGTAAPLKRVVLERQSFHGRPRANNNLLSASDAQNIKQQAERCRRSFASGDDLSISISSALTNAENEEEPIRKQQESNSNKPLSKPPRRTLSRDRLKQEITKTAEQPATFKRSSERQSLIPKRSSNSSTAEEKRQMFGRSASMDRNEILKRSALRGLQNKSLSANETLKHSKENLAEKPPIAKKPIMLTSTPVKQQPQQQQQPQTAFAQMHASQTYSPTANATTNSKPAQILVDAQEWERLRAIKERTDKELYYRVLQQQQQHNLQQQQQQQKAVAENIYEHLPQNGQVFVHQPTIHATLNRQPLQSQQQPQMFVRGSPQRNTFGGVIRNRQTSIVDGKPIGEVGNGKESAAPARSQSVLDDIIQTQNSIRRGYESETETPVVMRRKQQLSDSGVSTQSQPTRRIGGLLTREEILAKVKEFCRKSLNKTPTMMNAQQSHAPTMQAIYEQKDISPVSYISVENHNPANNHRMYATPQVPQRLQSLPAHSPQQKFVPIINAESAAAAAASPIYAHVVKRGSVQSAQSELYDTPQRPVLVRREAELMQNIYGTRKAGTLQRLPQDTYAATQYVLLENGKLSPVQLVNGYQNELYAHAQYVHPRQLQQMQPAYGYISAKEAQLQQQQQKQQQQPIIISRPSPRLLDGRSTPLILDRSSQQASQIYWTPQHLQQQRLLQQQQQTQQHNGLIPVQISPRYVLKQQPQQPVYVATSQPKLEVVGNRINLQYSPIIRSNTPIQRAQQQQQQQLQQKMQQQQQLRNMQENHNGNSEWESGSEAGEVQRIMEQQNQISKREQQQSRQSGKLKNNKLQNFKIKLARLFG